MKKSLKALGLMILAGVLVLGGLKAKNIYQATKVVGKCYSLAPEPVVFAVTDYDLETLSIDLEGVYKIEGYIVVFPFSATVKQREMETQVLPVATEIQCEQE